MKKIVLVLLFAISAFAQMTFTPKTEDFHYTESMCWVQEGEIVCNGGEMNIYQASDRVIADTIPISDCISYDSLRKWEQKIMATPEKYKKYNTRRPSGFFNTTVHLDWSCTDPFIHKLNSGNNTDLIYVRLYEVTFKGYDCPENPTEIFYDNEWTAGRVLHECVKNADEYEVHDLDWNEWHRPHKGIVYPGTIIRRK